MQSTNNAANTNRLVKGQKRADAKYRRKHAVVKLLVKQKWKDKEQNKQRKRRKRR